MSDRYLIRQDRNGFAYGSTLHEGDSEAAQIEQAERWQERLNANYQSRKGYRGVCPTVQLFKLIYEGKPFRVGKPRKVVAA